MLLAPDPVGVPGEIGPVVVLEEAVERRVAAAHEIGFAVEVGVAAGGIEMKFAHAEGRDHLVRRRGHFQRVEERVLG
jgi:hypothetical protein